jgi:hypothetical protein
MFSIAIINLLIVIIAMVSLTVMIFINKRD